MAQITFPFEHVLGLAPLEQRNYFVSSPVDLAKLKVNPFEAILNSASSYKAFMC